MERVVTNKTTGTSLYETHTKAPSPSYNVLPRLILPYCVTDVVLQRGSRYKCGVNNTKVDKCSTTGVTHLPSTRFVTPDLKGGVSLLLS